MLIKLYFCLAAVLPVALAGSTPKYSQAAIDSGAALAGLNSIALLNSRKSLGGSCTASNLKIRQEWRTLSSAQRKSFVAAVKCVQSSPSLFPAGQVPGAVSLFDDFVAVHLNLTLFVHLSATFLTWHRYYLHTYETKLQACGYKGNLPYWEWGYDINSPRNSPVFDGSDTSLGSDGAFIPHAGLQLLTPGAETPIIFAPGTGGGCVFKGPFKDMVVHIGPVALPIYGTTNYTGQPNPFLDNPRCLKRDLTADSTRRFATFRNTTDLILGTSTIELFQAVMQGDPRYTTGTIGIHGGGHYTISGDPGGDPWISPGDPAFYLHHAQLDRVYWIWQFLDIANRQNVWGTGTFLDFPPSPNVTLNDYLDLGVLNKPIQIKDMISTVGGKPLCYVYI
ncbi:tyrosinase-like protein [Bombardia bombarda]|uniref:Tyrosinase-like protein n=1 Tax=Bombardia bombarda TaxID=252184 RepID=A0AA39TW36_9PEZI|nr:tyrosinase-like protein [Bombardia bombarda]